jgi:hypothetical protein
VQGSKSSGWRARLALVALGVACLLGVSIPLALSDGGTPTWQLKSYYSRGVDRSFKTDLYEEMDRVPRVLVFGGSRSLRMDPATIRQKTGLVSFNFGMHNGHPEDAWAFTDYVLDQHPDKPPTVIWCVQASLFKDVPMNPGLIVDERLSQAFPKALIDAKMGWAMKQPKRNLLSSRRYGYDGMLWWNGYDTKRREGLTLDRSLTGYLDAKMLAKAGNRELPHNTRAMAYFARTIRLLNKYKIKPLIVIMPYHPRALSAFLSVGWGVKERWLENYLRNLQGRLDFRVLNCLKLSTFGGATDGFYDGAHLTASNSRKLIRYCIAHAPGCFKLPKPPTPTPTPTPTPSPSPSASGSPTQPVAPPPYTPVPEETGVPADFLE